MTREIDTKKSKDAILQAKARYSRIYKEFNFIIIPISKGYDVNNAFCDKYLSLLEYSSYCKYLVYNIHTDKYYIYDR